MHSSAYFCKCVCCHWSMVEIQRKWGGGLVKQKLTEDVHVAIGRSKRFVNFQHTRLFIRSKIHVCTSSPELLAFLRAFSSLAFLRSSFSLAFSCFAASRASMICIFSRLVRTLPHDFPLFVGCLLGGTGVRRNLDKALTGCTGASNKQESPNSTSLEALVSPHDE